MRIRRVGIVGLLACGLSLAAASGIAQGRATRLRGVDVSNYQPSVDWGAVRRSGRRFAFVLATDGPSFSSPTFRTQYLLPYCPSQTLSDSEFRRIQVSLEGVPDNNTYKVRHRTGYYTWKENQTR